MNKQSASVIFKSCLGNYRRILRYFFTSLGVLFLMGLIGLSIFVRLGEKAVKTMVSDIVTETKESGVTVEEITVSITENFMDSFHLDNFLSVNDSDHDGLISVNESKKALKQLFTDTFQKTVAEYQGYADRISEIADRTVSRLTAYGMVVVILQLVGVLISKELIDYFAALDLEHRKPGCVFLSRLGSQLLNLAAMLVIIYLLGKIPVIGLVLVILSPVFYCVISLLTADLMLPRSSRLPVKEVLHPANFLLLLLGDLLCILVTLVVGFLFYRLFNPVIALYVDVAFLVVLASAVSINSDALIYRMLEEKTVKE